MSFLTSIFRKTASQSQKSNPSSGRSNDRPNRSDIRRAALLLDAVGRFEMNE